MNKWLELVKLLAPIVITFVNPKLAPVAGKITDAIHEAEQIKGATGPDKLAHVQVIAGKAVDVVNAAKGKEVISKDNLNEVVQEAVDTVVAATNIVVKPVAPSDLKDVS